MTATYRAIGQLTIRSDPSGIPMMVDGRKCVTPCSVERPDGATVQVTAPETLDTAADSRIVFTSWNDSADPARGLTAAADPAA
jgi:hypothetical protein